MEYRKPTISVRTHICSLNYEGSLPNMERVGAVNMFERFINKHSLRCSAFYGDGNSSSFTAAVKMYGEHYPVVKYECIGRRWKLLLQASQPKIGTV